MKCICKIEVEKLEKDLKNLKSSTLAIPGLMPEIPPLDASVNESGSGNESDSLEISQGDGRALQLLIVVLLGECE